MKDKLNNIIALMAEAEMIAEQIAAVEKLRNRLEDKELIISVMGQFKRGKTSLINAILKDELLPVGIIPLTSVVTQIRNGDFKAAVHFKDESSAEIMREELPEYISETKNKNNSKNVDFVELWYPCKLLKNNIILVDTPGIGSMHKHNTDVSYSFIQKSDAVLFMLSVDSPINELEMEFLLQAKRYASKFYFVVNKIDTINDSNKEEYISYCKNNLENILDTQNIEIYPISAVTGEGIKETIEVITRDISSSGEQILKESVCIKAAEIIKESLSKLDLYLSAISLPFDKLIEKTKAIDAKQKEMDNIADETILLLKQQTKKLVEEIDQSLTEKLKTIKNNVKNKLESAYEDSENERTKDLEKNLNDVLERALETELEEINEYGLSSLNEGYKNIVCTLNEKINQAKIFIAQVLKEFFDVDYQYETKEYLVSQRSDYYLRINKINIESLLDINGLYHIMPSRIANPKIFNKFLNQMDNDLQINKTNMIYNYRYKMQESLRVLYDDFKTDISSMQAELMRLLDHAKSYSERVGAYSNEQVAKIERIKSRLAFIMHELNSEI